MASSSFLYRNLEKKLLHIARTVGMNAGHMAVLGIKNEEISGLEHVSLVLAALAVKLNVLLGVVLTNALAKAHTLGRHNADDLLARKNELNVDELLVRLKLRVLNSLGNVLRNYSVSSVLERVLAVFNAVL